MTSTEVLEEKMENLEKTRVKKNECEKCQSDNRHYIFNQVNEMFLRLEGKIDNLSETKTKTAVNHSSIKDLKKLIAGMIIEFRWLMGIAGVIMCFVAGFIWSAVKDHEHDDMKDTTNKVEIIWNDTYNNLDN